MIHNVCVSERQTDRDRERQRQSLYIYIKHYIYMYLMFFMHTCSTIIYYGMHSYVDTDVC